MPTTDAGMTPFLKLLAGPPVSLSKALLSTFNPQNAQQALFDFFSDPNVQNLLGPGVSSGGFVAPGALTSALDVLFGLAEPDWPGATAGSSTAVADALGQ